MTTWKNKGDTRPKSCSTKLISNTSPSSLRYLTRAGMNQEKSNFAKSPASEARLVMRMSSPVQWLAKTSMGSIVGLLVRLLPQANWGQSPNFPG